MCGSRSLPLIKTLPPCFSFFLSLLPLTTMLSSAVYSSVHSSCHLRLPSSRPPLLSASGRDAISAISADLLILNDACKLLLSIAGFIYLLTNDYPWCLALPRTVVCVIKYPGPLLVEPALAVCLHPHSLGGIPSPCIPLQIGSAGMLNNVYERSYIFLTLKFTECI